MGLAPVVALPRQIAFFRSPLGYDTDSGGTTEGQAHTRTSFITYIHDLHHRLPHHSGAILFP